MTPKESFLLVVLAGIALGCDGDATALTGVSGRIAFLATIVDTRTTELRVVDVQTGVTRLAAGADSVSPPHWSPDASRIIFVGRLQGRVGLRLAHFDGTNWKTEWLNGPPGSSPVFAPDGRSIAFSSKQGGGSAIYLMDLESRIVRRLTDASSSDSDPEWSPDGGRIAFVSRPGATATSAALWIMGADGTGRRQLADEVTSRPRWSPAGGRIAFVAGGRTLTVVDVQTGSRREIAADAGQGAWSSDGSRLVFEGSGQKPAQIVAAGVDGTGFAELTGNDRFNRQPAWSKDGNWIVYVSGGCQSPWLPCLERNHEVYVMRHDGSGAAKLTHGVEWATFPEWAP